MSLQTGMLKVNSFSYCLKGESYFSHKFHLSTRGIWAKDSWNILLSNDMLRKLTHQQF